MANVIENEAENVTERIFRYLWKSDSCVFYLRNYLSSPAATEELELYENRNWTILKISGVVGFFADGVTTVSYCTYNMVLFKYYSIILFSFLATCVVF